MTWTFYRSFDDFTPQHLYDVLKLRQDIFIIEQECIYDDIDGLDDRSQHLILIDEDKIVGYLRIVPPGIKYDEYSLGRILVDQRNRNRGLGKKVVEKGIEIVKSEGARAIRIEAQAHLENFYKDLGFRSVSEIYSVDDIPHLQMLLTI